MGPLAALPGSLHGTSHKTFVFSEVPLDGRVLEADVARSPVEMEILFREDPANDREYGAVSRIGTMEPGGKRSRSEPRFLCREVPRFPSQLRKLCTGAGILPPREMNSSDPP